MNEKNGKLETEHKRDKKAYLWIFALIISFAAFDVAQNSGTSVLGMKITVNNTDLCAWSSGAGNCTGSRYNNTNYTADTDIEIFLMSHNLQPASMRLNLSINGTIIMAKRVRTTSAEDTYNSISAIIPKNSTYSVHYSDVHHVEWREYPIHTGNVTSALPVPVVVKGTAVLNAGSVVVSENSVTANSLVFLTPQDSGSGNIGSVWVSARNPGADFTISSTNALDDRMVAYEIIEP